MKQALEHFLFPGKASREAFFQKVQSEFSFLSPGGGLEIEDDTDNHPKGFCNAVLLVRTQNIVFRFVKDRSEERVELAHRNGDCEWELIEWVFWVVQETPELPSWSSLHTLAEEVRDCLPTLQKLYSDEEYPLLRRALLQRRSEERDRWIKEHR